MQSQIARKPRLCSIGGVDPGRYTSRQSGPRPRRPGERCHVEVETQSDLPRALLELTDISACAYIREQLGEHLMSFAVPMRMFAEIEANVAGSLLKRLVGRN